MSSRRVSGLSEDSGDVQQVFSYKHYHFLAVSTRQQSSELELDWRVPQERAE
mgnify:CR=1 FL=1